MKKFCASKLENRDEMENPSKTECNRNKKI